MVSNIAPWVAENSYYPAAARANDSRTSPLGARALRTRHADHTAGIKTGACASTGREALVGSSPSRENTHGSSAGLSSLSRLFRELDRVSRASAEKEREARSRERARLRSDSASFPSNQISQRENRFSQQFS